MIDYGCVPFSRSTAGAETLQRAPLYMPVTLGMAGLSGYLEEASLPGA